MSDKRSKAIWTRMALGQRRIKRHKGDKVELGSHRLVHETSKCGGLRWVRLRVDERRGDVREASSRFLSGAGSRHLMEEDERALGRVDPQGTVLTSGSEPGTPVEETAGSGTEVMEWRGCSCCRVGNRVSARTGRVRAPVQTHRLA